MEIKKIILSLSVISLFNCPAMNLNTMDLGAMRANLPKISLRDAPAYIERAKTLLQSSGLTNDQKLALIGQLNSLPQRGAKVKVGLANVLNTWNDYVTPIRGSSGGTSRTTNPIRGSSGGTSRTTNPIPPFVQPPQPPVFGQTPPPPFVQPPQPFVQPPQPFVQPPQQPQPFVQPPRQQNNMTVFGSVELVQLGENDIAAESVSIRLPNTGELIDINRGNIEDLDLSLTCLALSEVAGNESYDNNFIEALRRSVADDLNYGVYGNREQITNLYNVFIADPVRKVALERALGDQSALVNNIIFAYQHLNDGGNPNLISQISIDNDGSQITINLQNINAAKVSDCMKALQQVHQQQQAGNQIYDPSFEETLRNRVFDFFSEVESTEINSLQAVQQGAPALLPEAVGYNLAYPSIHHYSPENQPTARLIIATAARRTAQGLGLSSEEIWDIYSLLQLNNFNTEDVRHQHLVLLMQSFSGAYFYGVIVNKVNIGFDVGMVNCNELNLPNTLAALKILLKDVPNADVDESHFGIFENNKKRPNPILVNLLTKRALQLSSNSEALSMENEDVLANMLSNYFPGNEDSLCVDTPYSNELSTVRERISEEYESRRHRIQEVVDAKRELFNNLITGTGRMVSLQRYLDENPAPEGNRPEVPVYPVPDVGNQPEVPENLQNSIAGVQSDNIGSLENTINELNTWLGDNRAEDDENLARNPDQQGLYDYIRSEKMALEYDRLTALNRQAQNAYDDVVRPFDTIRDAALEKYMTDPDIEDNAMREYLSNALSDQMDSNILRDILDIFFPSTAVVVPPVEE